MNVETIQYEILASKTVTENTAEALRKRGIAVDLVENRAEALKRIREIIPEGAEVMTGGSTTLEEIGFTRLLKSGDHPWENWKDVIMAEKDEMRQNELRRRSSLSRYFLGSVHAVAQTGEVFVASASGSQIPSYAFTSDYVIWIVGIQKIVADFNEGLKRLREYALPLEDERVKKLGMSGSTIGKILVFEREINPNRKIHLIFVREKLGF